MISQLSPSPSPRSLGRKRPVVVAAHVPSPRHHPYGTRTRSKKALATPDPVEKYRPATHPTIPTDVVGSAEKAIMTIGDETSTTLMPAEVKDITEDQLLSTLELYLRRGDVNDSSLSDTSTEMAHAGEYTLDPTNYNNPEQASIVEVEAQSMQYPEHAVMADGLEQQPVEMPQEQNASHDANDPVVAEVQGSDGKVMTLHFDRQDDKIMKATVKALQSGSLTPLIKEELRCTIQSRRLAEGKAEMEVEFKAPLKRKEMTDDERKRALKRRSQNKEAAQRFRQRQKDTSDYLTEKISRLQSSSQSLIEAIDSLKREKEELQFMLKSHLQICDRSDVVHPEIDVQQLLSTSTAPAPALPTGKTTQYSTANTSLESVRDSRSGLSLQDLPSTSSYSVFSSSFDGSIPESASTCPGTADSGSVFFSDNEGDVLSASAQSAQLQQSSFFEQQPRHSNTQKDLLSLAADFCLEKADMAEPAYLLPEADAPVACCEEVVVGDDFTQEFEDEEDRRLDSCSSVDNASVCSASRGSVSPASLSISESTGDLRQSLVAAYSKVTAMDVMDTACASGTLEFQVDAACVSGAMSVPNFGVEQDFLLEEEKGQFS